MSKLVNVLRRSDVVVVEIDHPPVNALSNTLRAELAAALRSVFADPNLRAAVLTGAGKTFPAGADIREFDQPPGSVATADLCTLLDDAPKPVVAAMHGTALGGGFELALACHARVLSPDGQVGLPECRIGLIPGAGGTQRTPRLTGVLAALDLVAYGRPVPAGRALRMGLVDEIATDLLAAAVQRARELADAGAWPRVRDRPVPPFNREEFDAAVAAITSRARGALAPPAAAEAIGWAMDLPFDAACARERAASLALRGGAQSRALRHMFHAERVAARLPRISGHTPTAWPVRKVGVVGGGTMGSGIAVVMANSGLDVILVENGKETLQAAENRIAQLYHRHVSSGRMSKGERAERLSRIRFTTRLESLSDTDLVVESVPEELPLKQELFRRLSGIVRRDCILGSNTSRLNINLMADVIDAPERALGLHFFSPAHVMRLLEIVRADRTLPEALATALALARRIGKQPVIAGACDGFIGNRILSRWRAQCDFALEDGALPQEVDGAMKALGFPMGPYAVADMAGLDLGLASRRAAAATRDPRIRHSPIVDWICDLGRYGQKTGAGYYLHRDGKRLVDPVVTDLVLRASTERGIVRRDVPAAEIQTRVHAAMVNEGAKIVSEGIAQRPSDVDVVLVHGYGYPAWRGGPMHEADEIGLDVVLARVEQIYAANGPDWEPAPLLREMVAAGKRFADLNVA
jgi:3-hydroxyacyl-CoA dehydrogenase